MGVGITATAAAVTFVWSLLLTCRVWCSCYVFLVGGTCLRVKWDGIIPCVSLGGDVLRVPVGEDVLRVPVG